MLKLLIGLRFSHTNTVNAKKMVRILNVAEKNDAAKSLSEIMSGGRYRKREGFSRFNKIYEFEYNVLQQNCTMTMTSVSGHLLELRFVGQYSKWYGCSPVDLFNAPVQKYCPDNFTDIKRTLEREVRGCQSLIIWTDGDREGENIGFEIIQVCRAVKANVRIYRALFSEITPQAVARAVASLAAPHQNTSDAVDIRQELDLRIGAAFTRFQTLRLQKVFPEVLSDQVISYGSCQFPTLGFVVERYKQVQAFCPEPFWKISVTKDFNDSVVEFSWKRVRVFDHTACLVLYQHCLQSPEAKVTDVQSKPKSKWRPVALDTVELEKLVSRKLRINAKETMRIAEKLYTQGLISYPRTETNKFPAEFDLAGLVRMQTQDPNWGDFASGVLEAGPNPRNGNKTDQAHPPIHPTKYTSGLQGDERRVYEYVVRHFLACCSKDAQGQETLIEIDINGEKFGLQGLMIIARNYLDVYPYERWNAKVIPTLAVGEVFQPKSIEMNQGETSPPSLLTEADLIALMDKHGIGTDATHADHIEKIKSRLYVGVRPDGKFVPGELGMGLVEGYDAMGYEMSKPNLRSELEADLKRICEGTRDKNVVLQEQVQKYKEVFTEAMRQANKIDTALAEYFGDARSYDESAQAVAMAVPVRKCPNCGQQMVLKTKKDGKGWFISCMGYPNCRAAIWLPDFVLHASVEEAMCDKCAGVHLMKFKFKRGSVPPYIDLEYVGCVGGCDDTLSELFDLRSAARRVGSSQAPPSQPPRPPPRPPSQNRVPSQGNAVGDISHDSGYQSSFPGTNNSGLGGTGSSRSTRGGHNNSNSTARGRLTAVANRRPSLPQPTLGGSTENTVVCQCGDDARLLTVKKEGPNTGRQFYVCAKPQDVKCSFFLWADDSAGQSGEGNPQRMAGGRGGGGGGGGGDRIINRPYDNSNSTGGFADNVTVKCECGNNAKLLTVQKEGPNTGRQFYVCAKPRDEGCRFFQWADVEPSEQGRGQSARGRGSWQAARGRGGFAQQGNGRGHKRNLSATQSEQKPKKRCTCGICGEEGHTRRTCPNR